MYTSAEYPGGTLYTSANRPGGQILGGTLCTTTPVLEAAQTYCRYIGVLALGVERTMLYVDCTMLYVDCTMLYVDCAMLYVDCTML